MLLALSTFSAQVTLSFKYITYYSPRQHKSEMEAIKRKTLTSTISVLIKAKVQSIQ